MDSEERWERAEQFYEQNAFEVLSQELPVGVQSLITYIQDHFDLIRQRQEEEDCGGGSLYEYESQLVVAVSQLGEKFSYLVIRELLEGLFSDVFSIDRIVNVEAGEPVISPDHRREVNKVAGEMPAL